MSQSEKVRKLACPSSASSVRHAPLFVRSRTVATKAHAARGIEITEPRTWRVRSGIVAGRDSGLPVGDTFLASAAGFFCEDAVDAVQCRVPFATIRSVFAGVRRVGAHRPTLVDLDARQAGRFASSPRMEVGITESVAPDDVSVVASLPEIPLFRALLPSIVGARWAVRV